MNRPTAGTAIMHSKGAQNFSFVTITNPEESKTRSKKRAVRSHVAYYQHHKDDKAEGSSPRRKPNKRSVVKTKQLTPPTSLPPTPQLSSESSSESIKEEIIERRLAKIPSLSESSRSDVDAPVLEALGSGYGSFSGTRIDPFHSFPVPYQPHYQPILDFYITYILIDTPNSSPDGRVFRLRTAWFPFVMGNATIFYAALAFAGTIYYYRRKKPLEDPLLLDLRQRAILGINDLLSKSQPGPNDSVIGAVLCMSLLESMYGDADSYRVHMNGLQRMIQMRGGLGELGLDGLLERMIVWLDFNHAKVHKTDLFFGESVDVSTRASPFKHPKDSMNVDRGNSKVLR